MKELVEFIAKKLVDNPEDVEVTVIEGEDILSANAEGVRHDTASDKKAALGRAIHI